SFARFAQNESAVAIQLPADLGGREAAVAGQAIVEGAVLGRYRYGALRSSSYVTGPEPVTILAAAEHLGGLRAAPARGKALARATAIARDLSNAPGSLLNAPAFGELAERLAAAHGLEVEVFDKAALEEMGCGGLLGVNRGSADEPRMIKLSYRPEGA